ncbi:ABC transporter ATP-binding protein [Ancylobacter dichloromethanicus]|uniref:ABC transporter ATP-binding protein n=1 Tax=Ancylobacter dichloromethanicus TaxID=518825 RepID=A0A9W6J813_9HYPH|nr:ABC transporter ATP-binding protein [Ancylobacter dichloromethanicus]MBS7552689.1 ABC transporter ATP-binding protein [Ancylobacter dichloromethanicus]GLK72052.1 ABC transporter ATP-binding protein [Ancylobacter dichloromethanicus]
MTLELDHVSRSVRGVPHIRDVSLRLERGSLNVLLGATLAGKTSLMRLMAGLDVPSSGRVRVEGRDVTGLPVKKRSVAMVYQQFINYPSLTVYENIASPLRVAGLSRAEIEERVAAAAGLLKLEPYLGRTPLALSGGQQQRTAIARALVKRADLVLLDEPLANLDYKLREELREELPRIFASTGAVFVYATTEPTEALLLGGQTAALLEGGVTQFGPTADIYRRPANLATARVFSDPPLNTLRVTRQAHTVLLENGTVLPARGALARVPDGACTIGVRAHHLEVEDIAAAERAPGGDGLIRLGATIAVTEVTGSESFLHMDMGETRLTALVGGVRRLEPGAPVEVLIDPRHILLFDADGRAIAPARDAAAA